MLNMHYQNPTTGKETALCGRIERGGELRTFRHVPWVLCNDCLAIIDAIGIGNLSSSHALRDEAHLRKLQATIDSLSVAN